MGDLLWEVQASLSESLQESLRITDVQVSHLSCSVSIVHVQLFTKLPSNETETLSESSCLFAEDK